MQEAPGPGAAPRFATSSISNPPALPLLVSLLRRAAPEDQLWGLAAVKELLLQGVHNLAAADGAALNSLLIQWLQEAVAAEPTSAAAADEEPGSGSTAGGGSLQCTAQQGAHQLDSRLLLHQLLAVLTLSGSYSIAGPPSLERMVCWWLCGFDVSACVLTGRNLPIMRAARDLRALLQLLKPPPGGEPPSHCAALLEVGCFWENPALSLLCATTPTCLQQNQMNE